MKSTIYIPTYKRRKNTIIDYIKQFPNVKFVVDIEDYNENYSDIPKEKCLIVPVEHRGCRIKRHDIINDAKKTNSTFFMIDDDISQRVRYNDGRKCYSINLYEALEIHEKIHFENELDVSGGAMCSMVTGHWHKNTKKIGKQGIIVQMYLIDSTKVEPEWFTLNEDLMDDVYFNLQINLNKLKYLNLSQLFYAYKCTSVKSSLITTSGNDNAIKIVNSFLISKGNFDIRYAGGTTFPLLIVNRKSKQYDIIKEKYGKNKNIDAVIDFLKPVEKSELENFIEM